MTATSEPDLQSDEALLTRARAGDQDAIGQLWAAHYPSALRAAKALARQTSDAEELAADAFARVLRVITAGGGPRTALRPYLITAVRSSAIDQSRAARTSDVLTDEISDYADGMKGPLDPVHDATERGYIRQAFLTLPQRWQAVLWQTAVDHERLRTVAAELRLSENAVAALARRAREALREAYLQAHLHGGHVEDGCVPYIPALAGYVRGTSRSKPSPDLITHVDTCPACQRRVGELAQLNTNFAGVLVPAVLGVPAALLYRHAITAAPTSSTAAAAGGITRAAAVKTGAALTTAAVIVAAVLLLHRHHHMPAPVAAPEPTTAPATSSDAASPTTTSSAKPTRTPTRVSSPRPSSAVSTPAPASTPPPAPAPSTSAAAPPPKPVTVGLGLNGASAATTVTVDAGSGNLAGPLTLRLDLPAGVSVTSYSGPWAACAQQNTTLTCTTTADGQPTQHWTQHILTRWAPGAAGRVSATITGQNADNYPIQGSFSMLWPPGTTQLQH